MSTLVPLTVTAHLEQGVGLDSRFGVDLAALLAARIWKTELKPAGVDPSVVVDVPLAVCGDRDRDPDWHWCNTYALPVGLPQVDDPTEVHHLCSRLDQRPIETLSSWLPQVLHLYKSAYRYRWMPSVITVCRAVQWRAVGDPDAVRDLVAPIPAIGRKHASGEGAVVEWDVTVDPQGDATEWAHLHGDGTLGRPVDDRCSRLFPDVVDGGVGPAPYRPMRVQDRVTVPLRLPAPLPV